VLNDLKLPQTLCWFWSQKTRTGFEQRAQITNIRLWKEKLSKQNPLFLLFYLFSAVFVIVSAEVYILFKFKRRVKIVLIVEKSTCKNFTLKLHVNKVLFDFFFPFLSEDNNRLFQEKQTNEFPLCKQKIRFLFEKKGLSSNTNNLLTFLA